MRKPQWHRVALSLWFSVSLCLWGGCSLHAQTSDVRFTSVLDNPQVEVFTLDLPERSRAVVYQGTHDVIWVALSGGSMNFMRRDRAEAAALAIGDVRFFPAFQLTAVSTERGAVARGALIELKTRALSTSGCGCGTAIERAVCGCAAGAHLPGLWAFSLGQITLAGTTLGPGEGYQGAAYRNSMLLVAVTDVDLVDSAASAADASIRLGSGQARWLQAGAHQFRNVSSGAARFVTVEF